MVWKRWVLSMFTTPHKSNTVRYLFPFIPNHIVRYFWSEFMAKRRYICMYRLFSTKPSNKDVRIWLWLPEIYYLHTEWKQYKRNIRLFFVPILYVSMLISFLWLYFYLPSDKKKCEWKLPLRRYLIGWIHSHILIILYVCQSRISGVSPYYFYLSLFLCSFFAVSCRWRE